MHKLVFAYLDSAYCDLFIFYWHLPGYMQSSDSCVEPEAFYFTPGSVIKMAACSIGLEVVVWLTLGSIGRSSYTWKFYALGSSNQGVSSYQWF